MKSILIADQLDRKIPAEKIVWNNVSGRMRFAQNESLKSLQKVV